MLFRHRSLTRIALLAVSAATVTAAHAQEGHNHATKFRAKLTPAAGITTRAGGTAVVKPHKSEVRLEVTLNLAKIRDVTAVHLRQGGEGEDGPVIATLYGPADPAGAEKGKLFCRTVTRGDLTGPLAGSSVHDLIELLESDGVYISVETVANPGGEIRGQLEPPGHDHGHGHGH